jgi:hypothetical protein
VSIVTGSRLKACTCTKFTKFAIDGGSKPKSVWVYRYAELDGRNMIWVSILAGAFALFMIRRVWKEGGSDSIAWKWFVRLNWFGSIAFFQALELQRYLEGLTYRPFFGLYASLLLATLVWFSARLFVNIGRR